MNLREVQLSLAGQALSPIYTPPKATFHEKSGLVAVARSILVIVWRLLADPTVRFHDLGSDYYTSRLDTERQLRNHLAQLVALGYRVTVEPAA